MSEPDWLKGCVSCSRGKVGSTKHTKISRRYEIEIKLTGVRLLNSRNLATVQSAA